MRTLTDWAWFIGLESILFSFILGIFLAMQSKPYPFQTDLRPFPIAMGMIVVVFMFLVWAMFGGREEKELARGKG